jgi:hypothetical protein
MQRIGRRTSSFLLRQGDWTLIYHTGAPHQLFNLADDPNELRDLSATETERVRRMSRILREFCSPEEENLRASRLIVEQLAGDGPPVPASGPCRPGRAALKAAGTGPSGGAARPGRGLP